MPVLFSEEDEVTKNETGYENMSNPELIDAFLSRFESVGTKNVYRSELKKMDKFIGKPFNQVTKRNMIEFNGFLDTRSDYSRQRVHSTVRSFFDFLVWADVVHTDNNPTRGTFRRITPTTDLQSKCLLIEEVEALKKVALPVPRDYAMVAVLATTGTRISEMLNMKQSDCYQEYVKELGRKGWFITVVGKGHKTRPVYLVDGTVKAIERLLCGSIDTGSNEHFFQGFWDKKYNRLSATAARNRLDDLAKRAGINKPFTPHWFRHTFISQLVAHGGSPKDVQMIAGHSSFRSTEKYLWAVGRTVATLFPVEF
jgi:integrase/recombinase XerD